MTEQPNAFAAKVAAMAQATLRHAEDHRADDRRVILAAVKDSEKRCPPAPASAPPSTRPVTS